MKRIIIFLAIFYSIVLAENPTGMSLLTKMLDVMSQENVKAVMTQTIQTSSGDTRTFEYESFMGMDGENSLMIYTKPSRVKGNAVLMTDNSNNIWAYNQRTRRVRKLASHAKKQKFEGSDFTYEDMGSGDSWKKDFTPKYLGKEKIDGQNCYKIQLTKKNKDISYSKLICYLKTDNFFPVQIDYYNENKELLKSLYMKNIKIVENIPTPMKMIMKNHQDNTETIMEYKSITYDVEFNQRFFTENNLK